MSEFKIGKLTLKNNVLLSPLAGISDLPFRIINRQFGCQFAFTEMVDAASIKYRKGVKICKLETITEDSPLGSQLLGQDAGIMLEGALFLQDRGIDLIEVNASCPARKVIKKKAGAFLMKNTGRLKEILKLLAKNLKVPLTLKIRTGWDDNSLNAVEVALLAEDCGIDALVIHGRHCRQGHQGPVNYALIKAVKERLSIPVIGNGGIWCGRDALLMFEQTGCDGIMIARGALGNPWIFKEIDVFLSQGIILPRPGWDKVKDTLIQHLHFLINKDGVPLAIIKMRKFFRYYLKNLSGRKKIVSLLDKAKSEEEVISMLNSLQD